MSVEELVASVMEVEATHIDNDTGPATLSLWTSLKHLELIAAIEERYAIKLTTREIHTLTCVADIQRILQQRSII